MHLHKWLPWSDPVATYNSGHKQQWRVCEKCNKAQKRTMWWDHQTSVGQVVFAVKQSRGEDQ
jgi:hypothetical protein